MSPGSEILPGLSSAALVAVAAALVTVLALVVLGKVPLAYNVHNLRIRWRTTLMTALAFTLVVALLTVMLAFVNGMYALTQGSGQPGNVVVLAEGATDESFSTLVVTNIGLLEYPEQIVSENGRRLASRETYLVVNQPIIDPPKGRPRRRFLSVRGIEDAGLAASVHAVRLYDGGQWFSAAGVRETASGGETAIECVLGEGIAREMGRDRQPQALSSARIQDRLDVGDTFELNARTWFVTGVMQSAGSTFDSEVWAKRSLVGPMFGKEAYSSLVVRARDAAAAKELKEYYNKEFKQQSVSAQVETEYFASLTQTNQMFLWVIGVVTLIMAIGGIFGIMNTMFAAINQRRRDVGVLRLVGFRRRQILISFLLESIVIALVGGGLGLAIGSLCHGYTANSIVSSGQGGGKFVVLRMAVDGNVLSVGVLLALLMGVVGGIFPSLGAMRLRALDALK